MNGWILAQGNRAHLIRIRRQHFLSVRTVTLTLHRPCESDSIMVHRRDHRADRRREKRDEEHKRRHRTVPSFRD